MYIHRKSLSIMNKHGACPTDYGRLALASRFPSGTDQPWEMETILCQPSSTPCNWQPSVDSHKDSCDFSGTIRYRIAFFSFPVNGWVGVWRCTRDRFRFKVCYQFSMDKLNAIIAMRTELLTVLENEESMFHLSRPPPHLLHLTSGRDGSHLKCYHQWGYNQLSTRRPSY